VSFQTLLNCLDGVGTQDGVIVKVIENAAGGRLKLFRPQHLSVTYSAMKK
jgi:hypothetical protein